MPEDGRRYEVIEGDLIVSPSPNYGHQFVVSKLLRLLGAHVDAEIGGTVLCAPFDVKFEYDSVVEPDLLYFRAGHTLKESTKFASVAPDLAVEVLSPSSHERDLGAKKKLFAKHGVPHYWAIDPDARTLTEFELSGELYRVAAERSETESFEPSLFPGLRIAVSALFPPPDPA